jgi:class 3 adenylate cyclase
VLGLLALSDGPQPAAAAPSSVESGTPAVDDQPVLELSGRGDQGLDLVGHWRYLDAPRDATPDALAGPTLRARFAALDRYQPPSDDRTVWVRIRLRGPTKEPWVLVVPYAILRGWDVTLYQGQPGRWVATQVTRWTSLSARVMHDPGAIFPLGVLGSQADELYLRLDRSVLSNVTPFKRNYALLMPERKFYYHKDIELVLFGIMFGSLIIMAIYNFFIYLSGQDRSYAWFSATLVGYILYYLEILGIVTNFILIDRPWIFLSPIFSVAGCNMMAISFPHFMFSYLGIGKRYRIERLMAYIGMVIIAISITWAFVALLLNRPSDFRPFNYSALGLLVCCAVIILRSVLTRQREALFFLASSLALMGGVVVQVLLNVGLIGSSVWSRYTLPFGILLQVVVMAVALADRLRLNRLALIEREKSERLLLTMLPAPIAQRLKAGESPIADRHAEVTVLFADIAGFTPLSAELPPERIVLTLNRLFSRFDALTRERGLEKIKTIGDCYMVVGGLPLPRPDHAEAVADLALALLDAVHAIEPGESPVDIRVRIGIHCGSAVAGVIGTTKPAYDLWGDTVNTASRMESHGEPGRIHCTEAIHARLVSRFEFRERGEIEVRGKGRMRTYFLVGRRPSSSSSPPAAVD